MIYKQKKASPSSLIVHVQLNEEIQDALGKSSRRAGQTEERKSAVVVKSDEDDDDLEGQMKFDVVDSLLTKSISCLTFTVSPLIMLHIGCH